MKTFFKAALFFVLLFLALNADIFAQYTVNTPGVINKDGKIVQVYAHRGIRSFAPENSLSAYKAGLEVGCDWVDMDIVMSKDGCVMVSHDIWLNPDIVRDSNGKFLAKSKSDLIKNVPKEKLTEFLQPYLVKNLTAAQLKQYDVGKINPDSPYAKYFPDQYSIDGTRMPTLKEVIKYVDNITGKKVNFQIEFKTDPEHPDWTPTPSEFAKALYKVLKEENILNRCEVQSFDWRCLYELQKLSPGIKTAYLTEWDNEPGTPYSFYSGDPKIAGLWTGGKFVKDYDNSIPRMVKALGGACWEPEDAELTKEALDEAHKLGLKVVVWTWPEHIGTAFDAKLIEKMINWGVDGIITDDPARLISMLAARGYRVPKIKAVNTINRIVFFDI